MKPGVFSQLYVQIVFSPAHKDRLLRKDFRKDVFKYNVQVSTDDRFINTISDEFWPAARTSESVKYTGHEVCEVLSPLCQSQV